VIAQKLRHDSENQVHYRETQWIERRVGTRTRARRLGHSTDRTNVSQSSGGPTDDCVAAIVCCRESCDPFNQTRKNSMQPSTDWSSSFTICRGNLKRHPSNRLNKSPRNENILALPQKGSLSDRQPCDCCHQTAILRTIASPVTSGKSPSADGKTANVEFILTNVVQRSTEQPNSWTFASDKMS
jgi:hypothetical protein